MRLPKLDLGRYRGGVRDEAVSGEPGGERASGEPERKMARSGGLTRVEPTDLALTVAPKGAPEKARIVTLRCDPAGGTHPNAVEACQDLDGADGDPRNLNERAPTCTRELNPRTAVIQGRYENRKVDFDISAANPCMLRSATGSLFDFS